MNQTVSVKLAFGVVIFSVLSSLAIASIIAAAGAVQSNEHNQNFYNYTALFVGQGFMVVPLLLFLISNNCGTLVADNDGVFIASSTVPRHSIHASLPNKNNPT